MTPARVYLVVWWFDHFGGMERHVTDQAVALTRRGIEVTVFSETPLPAANRFGQELRAAGVRIVAPRAGAGLSEKLGKTRLYRLLAGLDREPPVSWPGLKDEYLRHQHVPESTRDLLLALEREAERSPPDIVHVHACRLAQHRVLQWAEARGYPSVHTEHVTISDWGGPFDPESPWIVGGTADAIACVSAYSRDSLMALLPAPRDIHVARHIIADPRLDDPAAGAPRARPEGEPASLLAVGRLATHKGYETLLQAMALLRDEGVSARLSIAGEGEQRGELEEMIARLDLSDRVSLLGQMTPAQVSGLWAKADIGVTPSLTEGLPLSIVEGMARGRPIIASRVGGIPEIIRHEETGLLVSPGDVAGFAAAIARVIRDPALAKALATGARRSFETGGWSEEAVTDQALAIYGQAAASRAARTASGTGGGWAEGQARRAAGRIQRVWVFVSQIAGFGEMEYAVAQQAEAMAQAGVEVSVFVEWPPRPFNSYVRSLRRAGVRVVTPFLPGLVVTRAWARMTGALGGAWRTRGLARAWARRAPDAIQIHGWRLGCEGLAGLLDLAAARGTPTVYTEHAGRAAEPPTASDLAMAERFGALSAASPSAEGYLAAAIGERRPVTLIRHIGQARPPAYDPETGRDRPFRVFALLPTDGTAKLAADLASMGIDLEIAEPQACDRPAQLAGCDAAVLSAAAPGFEDALAAAMSTFKPVVVCDAVDATTPIRHRANGLVVEGDPGSAAQELASDPLLARQFAVAARRTYERDGIRDATIVSELTALYGAAGGVHAQG